MTLEERIEAAEGPSRELDAEIAKMEGYRIVDEGHPIGRVCYDKNGHGVPLPAYTASIDAAMTLVPEGLYAEVGSDGRARIGATKWVHAATPALALCAAALRARGSHE